MTNNPSAADVERVIRDFLVRVNKPGAEIVGDADLYSEGVGLDSLEAAELSAVLEDEFGTDPFTNAELPSTVGDIFAFYGATAPARG